MIPTVSCSFSIANDMICVFIFVFGEQGNAYLCMTFDQKWETTPCPQISTGGYMGSHQGQLNPAASTFHERCRVPFSMVRYENSCKFRFFFSHKMWTHFIRKGFVYNCTQRIRSELVFFKFWYTFLLVIPPPAASYTTFLNPPMWVITHQD